MFVMNTCIIFYRNTLAPVGVGGGKKTGTGVSDGRRKYPALLEVSRNISGKAERGEAI
jgi:hypothetical protein